MLKTITYRVTCPLDVVWWATLEDYNFHNSRRFGLHGNRHPWFRSFGTTKLIRYGNW